MHGKTSSSIPEVVSLHQGTQRGAMVGLVEKEMMTIARPNFDIINRCIPSVQTLARSTWQPCRTAIFHVINVEPIIAPFISLPPFFLPSFLHFGPRTA